MLAKVHGLPKIKTFSLDIIILETNQHELCNHYEPNARYLMHDTRCTMHDCRQLEMIHHARYTIHDTCSISGQITHDTRYAETTQFNALDICV